MVDDIRINNIINKTLKYIYKIYTYKVYNIYTRSADNL